MEGTRIIDRGKYKIIIRPITKKYTQQEIDNFYEAIAKIIIKSKIRTN